jgi:hypothetical protein
MIARKGGDLDMKCKFGHVGLVVCTSDSRFGVASSSPDESIRV